MHSESILLPGICRLERAPSVCPRYGQLSRFQDSPSLALATYRLLVRLARILNLLLYH